MRPSAPPGASALPAGPPRPGRDQESGWPFVLPALVLIGAVAVLPVLSVLGLSFMRRELAFGISEFAGLDNYRALAGDARFWRALGNTVYFTFLSVSLEMLLGLGAALLLYRLARGRSMCA